MAPKGQLPVKGTISQAKEQSGYNEKIAIIVLSGVNLLMIGLFIIIFTIICKGE